MRLSRRSVSDNDSGVGSRAKPDALTDGSVRVRQAERPDGRSRSAALSGFSRIFVGRLDVITSIPFLILAINWTSGNAYHQQLMLLFVTYVFIALALYVPFILSGALSIAYSVYVAIGGYSVAIISVKTHLNVILAFPMGIVVAVGIALILGATTIRLSGFFLAAVSILFIYAAQDFFLDATPVTGGASGLGPIRSISLPGVTLSPADYITASVIVAWLIAVGLRNVRSRSFGLVTRARREVPAAIEAVGVRVPILTLVVLAIGAALGSVGGSLYALGSGIVLPDGFSLDVVIIALFTALLGGVNSPWGAFIGSALVVEFTYNLQQFQNTGTLFFSLAVIVVLLLAPKGLLGYGAEIKSLLFRLFRILTRRTG
jgi:branched-chain amino acid transport system permease protein